MEIVVINLKRSPDRRAFMEEQLRRLGLAFTFFEAVDGRALDPAAIDQYDRKCRLSRYGIDLTKGEIAAYLSHYTVVENARRAGFKWVCVLEDDVILPDAFPDILRYIEELGPRHELIALTSFRALRHIDVALIDDRYRLVRLLASPCTNGAYVLSAIGAAKLASAARTILRQIDITMGRYWAHGLRTFAVQPYPIHIDPQFESDIGSDRGDVWDLPGMGHWRTRRRVWKFADSVLRRAKNVEIMLEHRRTS